MTATADLFAAPEHGSDPGRYAKAFIKEAAVVEDRTRFEAIANSGQADRDGEVIDPFGWEIPDPLPSLLFSHDPEKIVGTVESVEKTEGGLRVTASISHATQFSRDIAAFVRDGTLKSLSVGFDPFSWIEPDGRRVERQRGEPVPMPRRGRKFLRQELLELSAVAVPADIGARILALKSLLPAQEMAPILGWTMTSSGPEGLRFTGFESPRSEPEPEPKPESWLKEFGLQEDSEGAAEALRKQGAVLNRSNKAALVQAKELIDRVLQSAERADREEDEAR